jgi:hypothetical protein
MVKDQVHVRNAEAAHLARTLARETGMTMSQVILEALRQYRPLRAAPVATERLALWRDLLREDGERRRDVEKPIETLYDDASGLPA